VSALRDLENRIFERINPAVRFAVTRYVLAIGVFVAVVAFGLVSVLHLGVDLLPEVNIPAVVIVTSYPGATPAVVDQQITQPMENTVSTLSNITDLNSSSSVGLSRVIISFDPSVDRNSAANQVSSLVSAASRLLPAGVEPPSIRTFDPNSQPILQFGLSGGGKSLAEVNDYVQNTLAPLLERVPGVANVGVDGGPAKQFQVLLSPERLRYFDLTPQQVSAAIVASALSQPIGIISSRGTALSFTTQNSPAGFTEVGDTLVDSSRGLRVRDLGVVRETPAISNYARVDGEPQVLVSIQRTTDSNSVAVAKGVRDLLARTTLPAGYKVTISNDTTGPIQASVQATYRELLLTALVVALIVVLFLGKLNAAFSVILAIPIALAASPVLYRLAGFSLNLVSLLALIVAIGIVVDDSIVVAENVERYRAMGLNLKDSVLRGASEVFSAVVAATLSLLAVLLPISFLGGFIGRYLMQFSLGLAAAVAFSLLEAVLFLTVRLAYTPQSRSLSWRDFAASFTRLPEDLRWGLRAWRRPLGIIAALALAAVLLATRHALYLPGLVLVGPALVALRYLGRILFRFLEALTGMLHGWTEAGLNWVRDAYTRSLAGTMRRGAWVLAGAGLLFALVAVLVVPRIPFNFVPQTDAGVLSVNLRYPPGTPIDTTNRGAGRLEAFLREQPEVDTIQTVVGSSTSGVGSIFAGTNAASFTVQLEPVGKRPNIFTLLPVYRGRMMALLRDQPGARVFVSSGGGFGGFGSALRLNLVAADFNTLLARNDRILQALQTNPYVVDVNSSLSNTNLENDFVPDPARLKGTGITPAAVAQALQTYATGTQASSVQQGGLSYPIQVQADPTVLSSGQSLLNLPVYSPTLKTSLQVGQLGSFLLNQAPVDIDRYNRLYTGSLSIDLKEDAPPALAMQNLLTRQLSKAGLIGGEVSLTSNTRFGPAALAAQLSSTGPAAFLLAMFLVYLVMAAQFNSWRYPVYLLLPVPLAVVGALLLVYFLGGGIDIFGLLGMLMLIGLSAKNAILYLDFVVQRLGRMPFKDALVESARLRFRPIVMTTLTVLVISFPLILGGGQGSEYGQRMGVVMLGGILFSAVLTFFVVPAAFYLFERKRVARREQVAGEQVASERQQPAQTGQPAGEAG
jgi:HAE1 family hydrophobic/amphiphilic exporter-1